MAEDDKKDVQIMEFPVNTEGTPDFSPTGAGTSDDSPSPKKGRNNLLYVAVGIIGIVIVISAIYVSGAITGFAVTDVNGDYISSTQAGDDAIVFVNEFLLENGGATLISIEEESGLYKINTDIDGQEVPIYSTKDGKYIILPQGFIDVEEFRDSMEGLEDQPEPVGEEVPKSDKPVVNVFVMSYCPYGLQMQKAMLPVMSLLGDKADININFVHYIMHGLKEVEENNRQYCIQKEQPDLLIDYLECFVQSDDTGKCQSDVGIDTEQLDSCLDDLEGEFAPTQTFEDSSENYPPYPVDAALSNQYGVRGSPTLVINGKTMSVQRSPEAIKSAVCDAFNTPPEECNTALSSNPAAPSIGPLEGGSASATAATCS